MGPYARYACRTAVYHSPLHTPVCAECPELGELVNLELNPPLAKLRFAIKHEVYELDNRAYYVFVNSGSGTGKEQGRDEMVEECTSFSPKCVGPPPRYAVLQPSAV